MQIKYLAHSSFLVTTEAGTRILFDPYEPGGYDGALRYGAIAEPATVVVTSHDHPDHGHTAGLPGNPDVISGLKLAQSGPHGGRRFPARRAPPRPEPGQGARRKRDGGPEADGLCLCHAGDLGHTLTPFQGQEVGPIDVLLLPVGGYFTIDAAEATQVRDRLEPRITVPMHYKTPKVDFPIASVEDPRGQGERASARHERAALACRPTSGNARIVVLEPAL